jgi:hypothetical protein
MQQKPITIDLRFQERPDVSNNILSQYPARLYHTKGLSRTDRELTDKEWECFVAEHPQASTITRDNFGFVAYYHN